MEETQRYVEMMRMRWAKHVRIRNRNLILVAVLSFLAGVVVFWLNIGQYFHDGVFP